MISRSVGKRRILGWLRQVPLAALLVGASLGAAGADESHPDLTGIWTMYVEAGKPAFTPSGFGPPLPYTAEGKRRVDEYRSLVGPDDNPGAHCLGSGMPESMMFSGAYPMELMQRPEQITVIYEAHNEVRRLYFGSKVIPEGDRVPDRNGYSIAHWEGKTLVVETGSLKEQEDQGYPHSEQAHISERYNLTTDARGHRVLLGQMTLTDPIFYTKPVVVEKKWRFDPKGILLPYECNEEAWLDRLDQLKKKKSATAAAAQH
jgi:hypothetical protein